MNTIALSTKIQYAIDAIKNGTSDRVVDPGTGIIYVLDIGLAHMGTIRYTEFDELTRFPIDTYDVKFGHQHTVHQVLFGAFSRYKQQVIADLEIPGMTRVEFDPMIIPALTQTYPTNIK